MSSKTNDRVAHWLRRQPPGRRIWLLLLAIVLGLGGLSMLLPKPSPQSASQATGSAAAVLPGGKTAIRSGQPAPAAIAAAMVADPQAVTSVKPGEAGRNVKTITVPVQRSASGAAADVPSEVVTVASGP
ncbi:MAG: hypothetical protein ACK5JT_23640, partial [Hyphomicrobiaceae bacterium]